MGKIYLGPFKNELKKKQREFEQHLMKAHGVETLAVDRKSIELMEADLAKGETAFEHLFQPDKFAVGSPAFRWRINSELLAEKMLFPAYRDPAGYARQQQKFRDYANQLRSNVNRAFKFIHDTSQSRQLWVVRYNLPTRLVIEKIATAMEGYLEAHKTDDNILYIWPQDAVWVLLGDDRFDLQVMLRVATSMPNDIETYTLATKESDAGLVEMAQMVVSTVLYAIPFVGNGIAAFEAWRGKDIWGHELSDVDRGILAASVALPLAFRLVKEGRALYTSERLARLYGAESEQWSRALSLGEKASADAEGMREIQNAEDAVAAERPLAKTAKEKLADTFKAMGLNSAGKVMQEARLDAKLEAAFKRVIAKQARLAGLDALALERMIAKGLDENLIKGQLLEELLEEYVTTLLKDPLGRVALGLGEVKGSLYFIPGHLIRDADALQLTDGIIVRYARDKLEIVAAFEVKSGASAAKELKYYSSYQSKAAELERIAEAKSTIKDLEERARLNGQPPPQVSVEEQLKKIVKSESRGQFGYDLERLSEGKVWINGREVPVELTVGPRKTKWFAVLPSDVNAKSILEAFVDETAADKAVNWNVEVLGLGIDQEGLKKAAQDIIKEAADLVSP